MKDIGMAPIASAPTSMEHIDRRMGNVQERTGAISSRIADLLYAMDSAAVPPKALDNESACAGATGLIHSFNNRLDIMENYLHDTEQLLLALESIIRLPKD